MPEGFGRQQARVFSAAMQIAMIGLGRMGGNMVKRLLGGGHEVVVFDRDAAAVDRLAKEGGVHAASSLQDLVGKLRPPRTAWVMIPPGPPTESTIAELAK